MGGVEEKAGDKNMEENRGEKRRGYITKRRVGRNRETSGGVGGYKLWKGANATDAGYREGGGGGAGAQFERVASVGGFNEVSCNYMH